MKLTAQQKQWNRLAHDDPFWAILTDPAKRHGGWTPAEFFSTGCWEIASVMEHAAALGYPAERAAALDFGCGAGRLTQAIATYFDRVTGIDIAPGMLDLARKYNQHGERCQYVLNADNNLHQFAGGSFDFVYSILVLQHLPAHHAREYLIEFVRVLRPGGLALFQLPSQLRSHSALQHIRYWLSLYGRRRIMGDPYIMEMYGVPRKTVVEDLERCGARVIEVQPDQGAGPEWESFRYAVTK